MAKPKANSDVAIRESLKDAIKEMVDGHGADKVLAVVKGVFSFRDYDCVVKLRAELHGHERSELGRLANVLRRAFPKPKENKYAHFSRAATGALQPQMSTTQFSADATPDGPELPQPE